MVLGLLVFRKGKIALKSFWLQTSEFCPLENVFGKCPVIYFLGYLNCMSCCLERLSYCLLESCNPGGIYRVVPGMKWTVKPTIHYSRTWRIGDEIIFSPNKILLAKTRQTCCCTLFVVCRQFWHGEWFFFDEKILLCSSTRPLPRRKSCIQCTPKNLFTKHGKCLLYTIRRTLFFCHFTPISPLFANNV